jgi:hypothetical protein
LPQTGRRNALLDVHGLLEKRILAHQLDGLEVVLAADDQAQVGADQIDIGNAVPLGQATGRLRQRCAC